MKALTAAEMREVDRLTTERHGVPRLRLMENAGKSVFDYVRSSFGDVTASGAAVLCGKGNNGGDGFVVARLLPGSGFKPRGFLFAEPDAVRGEAQENLVRLKRAEADIRIVTSVAEWDAARSDVAKSRLIVDALLGTGLAGQVAALLASVIHSVNEMSRDATARHPEAVVAVDTPSGLPADGE